MAPSWHQQSDRAVAEALRVKLDELEEGDLFARLGIGYDADTAVIRAAFLSATKAFHPSRFARRPDDARRLANEVFLLIKGAYVQLSSESGRAKELKKHGPTQSPAVTQPSPTKPRTSTPVVKIAASAKPATGQSSTSAPAPDSKAPANRAATASLNRQERFAAAVAMITQGEFDSASTEFEALATENATMSKFRVYQHYALGRQHAEAYRYGDARREYEAALELHANFGLATQGLEQLPGQGGGTSSVEEPEAPSKKRGLFSRLFRK